MERPIDLLAEAAKSHGFEITTVDASLILGKWKEEDAAIFIYDNPEEKEVLYAFLDSQVPFRAVASLVTMDEGLLSALDREGVIVWNKTRLEALLGRHLLLVKAGMHLEEPLFPPAAPKPQEVFLAPLDIKGEQSLVPRVTRAEAEHKAARVGGFEFQQMLVPHYLFRYRCILQSTDGVERPKQGMVWVDAVGGEQREINTPFDSMDELDSPHFKMEPEVEMVDAIDLAMEGIVLFNTNEAEEVRHTGTATIFEKQKTYPIQQSIETELIGLLYIPMWNIEGSRGTLTINAVTGDIVDEQTYHLRD